ncbi:hypothetical protein [Nonomuraea sp. NPDC050540]|uniref:hypothetical protein n=1 Tax=Nonomuraea sp. NPDC050540 TaxID=3364367 RepID=UPI0037B4051A
MPSGAQHDRGLPGFRGDLLGAVAHAQRARFEPGRQDAMQFGPVQGVERGAVAAFDAFRRDVPDASPLHALPGLDDNAVRFAYTSMLGLLSLHQSGAFTALDWPHHLSPRTGRTVTADRERLITFITAGILTALTAQETPTGQALSP